MCRSHVLSPGSGFDLCGLIFAFAEFSQAEPFHISTCCTFGLSIFAAKTWVNGFSNFLQQIDAPGPFPFSPRQRMPKLFDLNA